MNLLLFYTTFFTNAGVIGHASKHGPATPRANVTCGPLSPAIEHVFQEENMHVNFFSLDVEGAERLVLDTINFDKVKVDVFMIEVRNHVCDDDSCEVRKEVRAKMKELGYRRYDEGDIVPKSDIYVHPTSHFQIKESSYNTLKQENALSRVSYYD